MTDLNEMWQELARYQPYADKRGFGDAWRRMCKERAGKAPWSAAWSAAWSARDAAAKTAYAAAWAAAKAADATDAMYAALSVTSEPAEWAQHAIGKIREAIEQEEP